MQTVGIGTRVLNYIIDTLIVFLIAFLISKAWNWYVVYWQYTYIGFYYFFFGIQVLYYFIWESISGRTAGKLISQTKVINKNGLKPSVGAIFIRSISRIILIDGFFFPFLNKTLHDYFSGTEVVEN